MRNQRAIYTGIRELRELAAMGEADPRHPRRPSDAKRIRRASGGRRKVTERHAGLELTLEQLPEVHSAGCPTGEALRWTDLKPLALA